MIERHWKGIAKTEKADAYIKHLEGETFPGLKKISGFINASILRRSVAEGIEFLIVTTWESMEAIKEFAGDGVDKAVVPVVAQEMMIDFDRHVVHYVVVRKTDNS
jgi:heme-degrading monooxygenase HmoA